MSTYEVLLFIHILGAFLLVGGAGLGAVTYVLMRRTRSSRALAQLLVMNGASTDIETEDGKTPAELAYEFEHDEVADYLRMQQ